MSSGLYLEWESRSEVGKDMEETDHQMVFLAGTRWIGCGWGERLDTESKEPADCKQVACSYVEPGVCRQHICLHCISALALLCRCVGAVLPCLVGMFFN